VDERLETVDGRPFTIDQELAGNPVAFFQIPFSRNDSSLVLSQSCDARRMAIYRLHCEFHYELRHIEAGKTKGEMSNGVTFVVFESAKGKPCRSLTSPRPNGTRSKGSVQKERA
jgi:hypothetical protein